MMFDLKLQNQIHKLRWEFVSGFIPDLERRRHYDSILDFGCWRADVDLLATDASMSEYCPWPTLTPIVVAGKEGAPDAGALRLASKVLTAPSRELSGLRALNPVFRMSTDEWMLRTIWFPFQTYKPCWFVEFESQYGGEASFAITPTVIGGENTTIQNVDAPPHSWASAPAIVRYCIAELHQAGIADPMFDSLLDHIRRATVLGPEVVPQLRRIVDRRRDSHLKKLLSRLPV